MKKLITVLFVGVFLCSGVASADLIWTEDFESANWLDNWTIVDPDWGDLFIRENNSLNGSKSLVMEDQVVTAGFPMYIGRDVIIPDYTRIVNIGLSLNVNSYGPETTGPAINLVNDSGYSKKDWGNRFANFQTSHPTVPDKHLLWSDTLGINKVDTGLVLDTNNWYDFIFSADLVAGSVHLSAKNSESSEYTDYGTYYINEHSEGTFDTIFLGCGLSWGVGSVVEWENITISSEPVPEPTTILLLGTGLIGLAGFRRKSRRS